MALSGIGGYGPQRDQKSIAPAESRKMDARAEAGGSPAQAGSFSPLACFLTVIRAPSRK